MKKGMYVLLFCLGWALAVHGQPLGNWDDLADSPEIRLSRAIQIPTLSSQAAEDSTWNLNFRKFHSFLEESYPVVHQQLQRTVINQHSLLYKWEGSQDSLSPILLYAHMDVVPVETDLDTTWSHDPFGGSMVDGYIWGRGALDDKYRIVAMMDAVAELLRAGHRPRRTVYMAFGHDEELGGNQGARAIAEWLEKRRVRFASVMDEGLSVLEEVIPDVDQPIALVGMGEKGSLNLRLEVNGRGGHSAVPPEATSIGILSRAIDRLQSNPFPARMLPVVEENLRVLEPYLPPKYRLGIKNMWLFKGQVLKALSEDQVTDALIRTKLSPTVISGGVKYNVLPKEAHAILNLRLLPGDSIAYALERVRKTIDDPRVEIKVVGEPKEASPVTDYHSATFDSLKTVIQEVFPGVPIAPALMPAGTDSKHFTGLSRNLFRFSPIRLNRIEGARIHNLDERIATASLHQAIRFYRAWILHNT